MAPPDRPPRIVLGETDRRGWGRDLGRVAIVHELAMGTGAREAQGLDVDDRASGARR